MRDLGLARRLLYDCCDCQPCLRHGCPLAQVVTGRLHNRIFLCPLMSSRIFLFPPDGPDTPTVSPKDTVYKVGSNIKMSCESASNPQATYSWMFNGQRWKFSKDVYINSTTLNYTGEYVCTAYNHMTRKTSSVVKKLTIFGKWMPGTAGPVSGVVSGCTSTKGRKELHGWCPQSQANPSLLGQFPDSGDTLSPKQPDVSLLA